jgi:phosphatidylserine/phosphatidylglycerophosphate/cardiolipin synthase-like enzyme
VSRVFGRTLPLLALGALAACRSAPAPAAAPAASCPAPASALAWEVYFSPAGGATDAVVRRLASARREVLVQAYHFTSRPIAEALVAAHRRGVRVEVIVDPSQARDGAEVAALLARAGIAPLVDGTHAIAHDKVLVIDGATVVTGSFNFTRSAETRNAENLLVVDDARLAARYARNFAAHRRHAAAAP